MFFRVLTLSVTPRLLLIKNKLGKQGTMGNFANFGFQGSATNICVHNLLKS